MTTSPTPSTIKHPQTERERAIVLQQLFRHVKEEAAALIALSTFSQKSKLQGELQTHAHLMQKTLDTIERYAR